MVGVTTKGMETLFLHYGCGDRHSKHWIYLTNDLYLIKAVDGREIREDRNLFGVSWR